MKKYYIDKIISIVILVAFISSVTMPEYAWALRPRNARNTEQIRQIWKAEIEKLIRELVDKREITSPAEAKEFALDRAKATGDLLDDELAKTAVFAWLDGPRGEIEIVGWERTAVVSTRFAEEKNRTAPFSTAEEEVSHKAITVILALEAKVNDSDIGVRHAAITALSSIYTELVKKGKMPISALEAKVNDANVAICQAAITALSSIYIELVRKGKMPLSVLEAKLKDPNPAVRQVAITALSPIYTELVRECEIMDRHYERYLSWTRMKIPFLEDEFSRYLELEGPAEEFLTSAAIVKPLLEMLREREENDFNIAIQAFSALLRACSEEKKSIYIQAIQQALHPLSAGLVKSLDICDLEGNVAILSKQMSKPISELAAALIALKAKEAGLIGSRGIQQKYLRNQVVYYSNLESSCRQLPTIGAKIHLYRKDNAQVYDEDVINKFQQEALIIFSMLGITARRATLLEGMENIELEILLPPSFSHEVLSETLFYLFDYGLLDRQRYDIEVQLTFEGNLTDQAKYISFAILASRPYEVPYPEKLTTLMGDEASILISGGGFFSDIRNGAAASKATGERTDYLGLLIPHYDTSASQTFRISTKKLMEGDKGIERIIKNTQLLSFTLMEYLKEESGQPAHKKASEAWQDFKKRIEQEAAEFEIPEGIFDITWLGEYNSNKGINIWRGLYPYLKGLHDVKMQNPNFHPAFCKLFNTAADTIEALLGEDTRDTYASSFAEQQGERSQKETQGKMSYGIDVPTEKIKFAKGASSQENLGRDYQLNRDVEEYTGPSVAVYRGVSEKVFGRMKRRGFERVPEEDLKRRTEEHPSFDWRYDEILHKGRTATSGTFAGAFEARTLQEEGRIIRIEIPADILLENGVLMLDLDAVHYFNKIKGKHISASEEIVQFNETIEEASSKNRQELKRLLAEASPEAIQDFIVHKEEIIIPHNHLNAFLSGCTEIPVHRDYNYLHFLVDGDVPFRINPLHFPLLWDDVARAVRDRQKAVSAKPVAGFYIWENDRFSIWFSCSEQTGEAYLDIKDKANTIISIKRPASDETWNMTRLSLYPYDNLANYTQAIRELQFSLQAHNSSLTRPIEFIVNLWENSGVLERPQKRSRVTEAEAEEQIRRVFEQIREKWDAIGEKELPDVQRYDIILRPRALERFTRDLQRGHEDIDEITEAIDETIRFETESIVCQVEATDSQRETVREAEAKLREYLNDLGLPYQPHKVIFVPFDRLIWECMGICFDYHHAVVLPAEFEDEIVWYSLFHELLHGQSPGCELRRLDEGMTEYLTVTLMMRLQKCTDFSPEAITKFYKETNLRLYNREEVQDVFRAGPSYGQDLEAIARLVAVTGEGPLLRAYFGGDYSELKEKLGVDVWRDIMDLAQRYESDIGKERDGEYLERVRGVLSARFPEPPPTQTQARFGEFEQAWDASQELVARVAPQAVNAPGCIVFNISRFFEGDDETIIAILRELQAELAKANKWFEFETDRYFMAGRAERLARYNAILKPYRDNPTYDAAAGNRVGVVGDLEISRLLENPNSVTLDSAIGIEGFDQAELTAEDIEELRPILILTATLIDLRHDPENEALLEFYKIQLEKLGARVPNLETIKDLAKDIETALRAARTLILPAIEALNVWEYYQDIMKSIEIIMRDV